MAHARIVQIGPVSLAFGLEWAPVLGNLQALASQARRRGATHRIVSGDPPAAQGLAYGVARRQRAWSAAELFARHHPRGTFACVVLLDDQSWHVLACHEGVALVRADRSYPDLLLAQQAIDALRLAYPRLQVNSAAMPGEPDGLLSSLAQRATSAAPLQPVRRFPRQAALLILLVVSLLAAGGRQWRAAPSDPRPDVDADAQWQQALNDRIAQRPVHGQRGTHALLKALYRQPAYTAGWALQAIRCRAQTGRLPWQCVSEYRRRDLRADNRGLLSAASADWTLDFPSLDRAYAHWSLALPSHAPQAPDLPRAALLARDWASSMQAVLPAFSVLRLGKPQALHVPAPVDDAGRPLARSPSLPNIMRRPLRVQGPLRSARLLEPLSAAVSWDAVSLTYASGSRAGLRASQLLLQLEGNLYENHS